MANTYLTRTFPSASNRKIWTWSAWIKRSGLGGTQTLMTQVDGWNGNSNAGFYIIGDQLTSYNFTSSLNAGTSSYNRPSRYLRDVNSWYHVVVRLDTTQSTASDRCRWYVNGEQLTNFAYANYPNQNQDCNFNTAAAHGIAGHTAGSNYFDGCMTHVHFTDGYSYAPSAFGETDTTTGEWKAKTSPSVNYGTNGFLILKDGNTITDQSSNSNAFTLAGGTLTDLKDNPENVFATMNPLDNYWQGFTFSNGNNTITTTNASQCYSTSSLMASSGKWYVECKPVSGGSEPEIGIFSKLTGANAGSNSQLSYNANGYSYRASNPGSVWYNGSAVSTGFSQYANGDIIGIALDLDNNKLYFSKNGVFGNSGNPTSGSTGTGAISIVDPASTTLGAYGFGMNETFDDQNKVFSWNFGNGFFGTTAITTNSGNGYSGAEGSSKFNYTVPTGYSALSTKGLNE